VELEWKLKAERGKVDHINREVGSARSSRACLLIVYRYTRTHSPHPPPWPAHSFLDHILSSLLPGPPTAPLVSAA
jgi:hypothetical protein